jgi:glutamyl-tRNA reductase
MRTLVLGCNHRSAPVEMREKLAFDGKAAPQALRMLGRKFPCSEAVLISTCNRIELYVARPLHGHPRIDELIAFMAGFHNVPAAEFASTLYSHEDAECVRHLFEVVSALDSMVLGETQILAQTKSAFELARTVRMVGPTLDGLFQRAFNVAKDIHTHTGIAAGRLSVGSTAVDLAKQIFSHFSDKIVMMVGAGKMGELTLTHLLSTQPRELWVTNRTDQRAIALADRIAAKHGVVTRPIPYPEWIQHLTEADIVISSTGSREPVLTAEQFKGIPARRRYRPLLLIDIAVPRDIDPEVGEAEGVYLYNIDDLQGVVEVNLSQRREAIRACHEIVEANVVEYIERQSRRDLGPLISALQDHFRQVGQTELDRMLPKLAGVSAHDRELIGQMLHRVTQKLLHDPVRLLNDKSANGAVRAYADALRALFKLHEE